MEDLRSRWRRLVGSFGGRGAQSGAEREPPTNAPYRSPGQRDPGEIALPPPPASAVRWLVSGGVVTALTAGVALVALTNEPAAIVESADADTDAPPEAEAPPSAVVAAPPPPCPDAELRALVAKGKTAIAKAKYADARDALDSALRCRPDDAEALSERGLAWFLDGDDEQANDDLALASQKTNKPGLLGTIWYRRGLVDDRAIGSGNAAYTTAYYLGRHEGAKAKVGSNACGTTVSRFRDGSLGDVAKRNASMPVLFASLHDEDTVGTGPQGEEAGDFFPDVVQFVDFARARDWLVAKGKTVSWAFLIGDRTAIYQCKGESAFTLETVNGIVHAHGHYATPWIRDRTDGHFVQHGCFNGTVTGVDAFFDPKRETAIIARRELPGRFPERASVPGPTVKLLPNGVVIGGFGCDETLEWEDREDAGPDAPEAGSSVDASRGTVDASGDR